MSKKSQTTTETLADDQELEAYMASFEAPIVTAASPTREGWFPAKITGFRLNYYVVDKKPMYPENLPDTADGKYPQHNLSISCQTDSLTARQDAKRDTDPFFEIAQGSKKNPACEGINLNIVLSEHLGIDIKKSLGFLTFLGGLLAPTGLIEGNAKDGYQLSSQLISTLYSGVKAKREAILASYEETGRLAEKDNKNHPSLIPAMLAEWQLENLKQLLVDPTGQSTATKLVCLLGVRDHYSGDGRKENFCKSFRYWWEVVESIEEDSEGTTFKIDNKGQDVVIELLV